MSISPPVRSLTDTSSTASLRPAGPSARAPSAPSASSAAIRIWYVGARVRGLGDAATGRSRPRSARGQGDVGRDVAAVAVALDLEGRSRGLAGRLQGPA